MILPHMMNTQVSHSSRVHPIIPRNKPQKNPNIICSSSSSISIFLISYLPVENP
jgi:hypothetical protein